MIFFVDFEASSLEKGGFPIEVGWVSETGDAESHLIRPAPGWEVWSAEAERIHRISLPQLLQEGAPHTWVAQRMAEVLTGHALFASAPSWDGQWLSKLLRAAGLPRHALRLRDTDEAQLEAVTAVLETLSAQPEGLREEIVAAGRQASEARAPAHRAAADARRELEIWRDIRSRAARAAAHR